MTRTHRIAAFACAVTFCSLTLTLAAQSTTSFSARLAWVPISGAERAGVAGKGTVAGTLTGSRLSINGSFEGLPAPATAARLHEGVAKAARGPVLAELAVTKATNGTISGSVDLMPRQVESLKQGKLYIQVHSEKGVAPDGSTLWGWLLRP